MNDKFEIEKYRRDLQIIEKQLNKDQAEKVFQDKSSNNHQVSKIKVDHKKLKQIESKQSLNFIPSNHEKHLNNKTRQYSSKKKVREQSEAIIFQINDEQAESPFKLIQDSKLHILPQNLSKQSQNHTYISLIDELRKRNNVYVLMKEKVQEYYPYKNQVLSPQLLYKLFEQYDRYKLLLAKIRKQ